MAQSGPPSPKTISAQPPMSSRTVLVSQESRERASSQGVHKLTTQLSDVLPVSEPDPDPIDVDVDTIDASGMEAGGPPSITKARNVESVTPMAVPVAHSEPYSLAEEAGTSSITGRNAEVTPMPTPPHLRDGELSSVSRKLKV
ncbi:hypothetical protein TorRG33x02_343040 [Trema orientale]|uniref:Uncharacterized protein n=1 Tax=Trema orientale TaxID=63057 RepID=A0A2P5AS02_TREOI|nr:hypothetical protein TorRG33x02_343040 [Trema orientale]